MIRTGMIRTLESVIAGVILILILISLFSFRPIQEVDPLPAYDILLSLDLTDQLRQDVTSNDAEAVWESITYHLPKAYNCHVTILDNKGKTNSHGPDPESPSTTASYFISSSNPKEVRVTIW